MADVTITAADVRLADPHMVSRVTAVAGEAISAGMPCYIASTGLVMKGVSTINLGASFDGIALTSAGAGESITLAQQGAKIYVGAHGLDIGAFFYTSDTAGLFSDASIPTPVLESPIAKATTDAVITVTRMDLPPAVNA